jgi:hypothetical protein
MSLDLGCFLVSFESLIHWTILHLIVKGRYFASILPSSFWFMYKNENQIEAIAMIFTSFVCDYYTPPHDFSLVDSIPNETRYDDDQLW